VQSIPGNDAAGLVGESESEQPEGRGVDHWPLEHGPAAIKALGGPAVTMRDDEYDAIYVLNPATGACTLIRY
jgi:hypothetical protein